MIPGLERHAHSLSSLTKSFIIPLITFIAIGLSQNLNLTFISRYDFLFLFFLSVYSFLVIIRYVSIKDICIVFIFQILGLLLEIHKVNIGAWNYPESSWIKVMNVPLYSSFMYGSVAMFVVQVWSRFHINLIRLPNTFLISLLIIVIYANFFFVAVSFRFRFMLALIVFFLFSRSRFEFMGSHDRRNIPLLFVFTGLGLLLWIAENIATYLGAWVYPGQKTNWVMIEYSKINSWFLLIVVFVIIADFLINVPRNNVSKI